jgi:hypothetical protein
LRFINGTINPRPLGARKRPKNYNGLTDLRKFIPLMNLAKITASMCSLPAGTGHTSYFSVPEIIKPSFQHSWLVVSTPMKNISQLG